MLRKLGEFTGTVVGISIIVLILALGVGALKLASLIFQWVF